MWIKLIFIYLLFMWLHDEVLCAKRLPLRYRSVNPNSELKSFEYDYDFIHPNRVSYKYQKSNPTTTERPLIRYWNNLVRNVRLPIPTITWNMTNPLVNLFNAGGEANVFETPVTELQYTTSKRRRKTIKKTETQQKNKKKRKRTNYEYDSYMQDENGEQQEEYMAMQQQPYYQNFASNNVMYFYDPNTKQYYEVQRVSSAGGKGEKYKNKNNNGYYSTDNNDYTAEENYVEQPAEANETIEVSNDEMQSNQKQPPIPLNDEDVSVVENFEDEGEDFDESKTNDDTEEMLRNVLGSYMKDDHWNRLRQRTKSRQHKKNQLIKTSKPRNSYNYYFLNRGVFDK